MRTPSLSLSRRAIAIAVGLAVLAVAAFAFLQDQATTTIHARFASAEGLHERDYVKVLGVKVGTVTEVENRGDSVHVTLEVDGDQAIPADARAAVVAPSLVSGRFVQLAPVYSTGPRLQDGDTIERDRTAVPLTFDDVKEQLTDLATTLGPPEKSTKGGALPELITSIDTSLRDGNAERLRSALAELHGAARVLRDGRSDFFRTIENLDTFTRNLAVHHAAVQGFTRELDLVSTTLAENRVLLRGALGDLAELLVVTQTYLRKHGGRITGSLEELNLLWAALADRSNELAGVLHIAPHALFDLHNIVEREAITGRSVLAGLDNAAQLVCGALLGTGASAEDCAEAIAPMLDLLGLSPAGAP